MDPVDEFARLKAEIGRLQDRAEELRAGFCGTGRACALTGSR